jgi:hypothetical protein
VDLTCPTALWITPTGQSTHPQSLSLTPPNIPVLQLVLPCLQLPHPAALHPFSGSGWSNIKSAIQKATINNGFVLLSNRGEKENRKRFRCNHNVIYQGYQLLGSTCGGKYEGTSGITVVYRKSTLTND